MNSKINIMDNKFKLRKKFNYLKNIVFDENDFKHKGTKFQIVKFFNNKIVQPHYHKKTTEVFLVINGKGLITINNTINYCRKNDVILCNIYDIHSFKGISNFTIAIFKINEKDGDIYDVET